MYQQICRLLIREQTSSEVTLREAYGKMAGAVGLALNILLSAAKIGVGMLFSNLSILADGVNNLSDASSSVITLIGFKLAGKPADKEHPYGHARFEYLASLAIAIIVLLLGMNLAQTAVKKILSGEGTVFSWLSILVLLGSILVKFWMMGFYRFVGHKICSQTLFAAAQDSLNDVIASSAVLLCIAVSALFAINIDGYVSLAVALFILFTGGKMIKETTDPLLGLAPDSELVARVTEKLSCYEGVEGFHDLIIHDYGPTRRFASVHVEMDSARDIMDCHDLTDIIEREFEREGLQLVVHLDPINTRDELVNSTRSRVTAIINSIDPCLSLHDFRMVLGKKHTNVIFDLVVPYKFNEEQVAQFKKMITAQIKTIDENYFAVIEIDRGDTVYE